MYHLEKIIKHKGINMWKKITVIGLLSLILSITIFLIVIFTNYIITFNRFNSFMTLENAIITTIILSVSFVIFASLMLIVIFKWKTTRK